MKWRFLIIFAVIFLSLGILTFGLQKGSSVNPILVLDLQEVAKHPQHFLTDKREVRIRGFVQTGSILRQGGDKAYFVMEQSGYRLNISYLGKTQIPDTFADGAPVRVDGYMKTKDVFIANRIEAKCASKYQVPSPELPMTK